MGWTYPTSWSAFPDEGWMPALQLRVTREGWDAFVAVKGNLIAPSQQDTRQWLSAMGGGGFLLAPGLRVQVQGSVSQHSVLEGWGLETAAYGMAARLLHTHGAPIGTHADFGLMRGAPELYEELVRPQTWEDGTASHLSVELGHLWLEQWMKGFAAPPLGAAFSLAVEGRVRWNRLRLHALLLGRDPLVLVFDRRATTQLPWPTSLLPGEERFPELGLTLGADYHLPTWGLTPGLAVRAMRLGALYGSAYFAADDWQLRGNPSPWLYNPGANGTLSAFALSVRPSLTWEPTRWLSLVGEVAHTLYLRDDSVLTFTALVQARL
jgi:hypothetical protein